MTKSKTTSITQEQLDKVAGLSSQDAAIQLGVGKTTVTDARRIARDNGGRLPYNYTTPEPERGRAEGEFFREDKTGDESVFTTQVFEDIGPADILAKFGRDPKKYRITGVLSESHWGSDDSGWKHSYKFRTELITDDELTIEDLPLLFSEVRAGEVRPVATRPTSGRANVVVWADPQTGKRDSRGGTPELIERMAGAKAALVRWLDAHPAPEAAFLSVGDEVESFENVPSQQFLNDLSFPQQLDLELTFELDFIRVLAAEHEDVLVAGTSSNHCAWRKGKDILGKPSDDYGLYLKRTLEKAMRLNSSFDHVTFVYPDDWDETNAVTVAGTKIAMAHGHQVNGPNNIVDWWKKQAFGRQASADADILLTGHFHHFRMEEVNAGKDGLEKPRFWIQAPTMDNGSSWVRNKWGNDSSPGLLVFQVDEHGLILDTLSIL